MNDFLRQCMLFPIENPDTEEYRAAVWYMGKTVAIGQLEELGYGLGEKIREEDKR